MLTASCQNCGAPKNPANYADNYCPSCTTTRSEAEQGFAAEHPEATESDILYVGRQALASVAHHAHRNFVDPRSFRGIGFGLIPVPPEDKRGTPGS